MTEQSGAVTVRQNHHSHSVKTGKIDGEIMVDLDANTPHVELPADVGAIFQEGQTEEHPARADGGVAQTEVVMDDSGISEEQAGWSVGLGALLIASAGYLWAGTSPTVGVIAAAGGALALYLGGSRFWGGPE